MRWGVVREVGCGMSCQAPTHKVGLGWAAAAAVCVCVCVCVCVRACARACVCMCVCVCVDTLHSSLEPS